MNIGVIGASGMAGQAIFNEAVSRGHHVVAYVRNAEKTRELLGDIDWIEKDAFALEADDFEGIDVIVNAYATEPSKAYRHIDLAAKLIGMFREQLNPRVVFILGAGSLQLADGTLLVEKLKSIPGSESWVAIPENQLKELEFLSLVDNVNWVGVSPSETFTTGDRLEPLLGTNRLLVNKDGKSIVSDKTFARAILDEIEHPKVIRARFSVCNK